VIYRYVREKFQQVDFINVNELRRGDMMHTTYPLDDITVVLTLSDRVVTADLGIQLGDPTEGENFIDAYMTHASRYALWSTALQLAESKLSKLTTLVDSLSFGDERNSKVKEYTRTLHQAKLLRQVLLAFSHRQEALLGLWSSPSDRDSILFQYRESLTNIKGVIEGHCSGIEAH